MFVCKSSPLPDLTVSRPSSPQSCYDKSSSETWKFFLYFSPPPGSVQDVN
jgi:hypothetical protein